MYKRQDESLDDLLLNGLQIIQKTGGFRFTLDSILLAHFVTLKNGDHIVDLGTGTGIIPLVLTTRAQKLRITGIEIQPEMAEMATTVSYTHLDVYKRQLLLFIFLLAAKAISDLD